MPTHTPNLALHLAPSSAGLRARPEWWVTTHPTKDGLQARPKPG